VLRPHPLEAKKLGLAPSSYLCKHVLPKQHQTYRIELDNQNVKSLARIKNAKSEMNVCCTIISMITNTITQK